MWPRGWLDQQHLGIAQTHKTIISWCHKEIFSQLKSGSIRAGVIWEANYILFVFKWIWAFCAVAEKQSPVIPKLQTASEKSCKGKMDFIEQRNSAGAWWKRGKNLSKPHRIWNKQVPFQETQKKTFSDYSHSHRSQSLPWSVHTQTLATKISLFNQCSSNRTITATASSLSTW